MSRDRKRAIEMLLARTALQDAEENKVLEAASIIEAAQRQEAAARKAAAQPARPGELLLRRFLTYENNAYV